MVAFLILEVLLFRLAPPIFLIHHYILIKRTDMLLLVPDLRIFGPCIDGLIILRGRYDISIEGVVEFEVEERKDEDGVLFVLDGLKLVTVEVQPDAVQQGDYVEVLAQGFAVLGTVLAAEVDI